MRPSILFWCGTLGLLASSCITPYEPEVVSPPRGYLVVDGFINSQGVSSFKLSHTTTLSSATAAQPESKARLLIETAAGQQFPLQETSPGTYTSARLQLDASQQYRLHLTAASGKEYVSTYSAVKTTPPIDSVTWAATPTGITISVNTHDPTGKAQYYRWNTEDTWEYTAVDYSHIEFAGGEIRPRTGVIPYRCWNTTFSPRINLSNSTRLSQDRIADYPVASLPFNSIKVRFRYSILVRQYAQTPEEYRYWEELRKTTESIGGLYDPLPTQVTGNITCVNDAQELAFGYVGAYSATERRLFIEAKELPAGWKPISGNEDCLGDTIRVFEFPRIRNFFTGANPAYIPLDYVYIGVGLFGYSYSSADCADCRKRGGTTTKPTFW